VASLGYGWSLDVDEDADWLFLRLWRTSEDSSLEPAVADVITEVAEQHGKYRLILELDQGIILFSQLVGQIITLHKRMYLRDGVLRLCCLSEQNVDVLRLMRLTERLAVYHDRGAAMAG